MKKIIDLGKVVKKHVSKMAETDKGNRYPANENVDKGDQLVEIEGRKSFMSGEEFAKCVEDGLVEGVEPATKIKYKKGVTQALIKEAAALGVEVYETTTKSELLEAIELAGLVAQAKEKGVENAETLSKEELLVEIGE